MIWMFRWFFLSRDQGNGEEKVLDHGIKFNMPLAKAQRMVKLFVGKKWRIFCQVTKVITNEKLMSTKIVTDKVFTNKVF